MSFKQIRIALLLLVLVLVVHHQFNQRARFASWETPVFVAIYPVNGDGSDAARRRIDTLTDRDFETIPTYFERESARYQVMLDRPIYIDIGNPIEYTPPEPPIDGGLFRRVAWVLGMRWWLFRLDKQGLSPDIIVIARYFDPQDHQMLPHSTGIESMRLAIANLFAGGGHAGANRVVLTHELLHTLGASDKYDLRNNMPLFPDGYAEPEKSPRFPQTRAEIMAGRIPLSAQQARQAASLEQTVIGPATAREIGWVQD